MGRDPPLARAEPPARAPAGLTTAMCWELLLRVCAAIFSRERTMLVQAFSSFCDIHRMWSSTSMMLLAISTITSVSCEESGRHQLRFAPVQPPPAANTPIHAFNSQKSGVTCLI